MKVYLIDSSNNNKIVNLFDTVKEARAYIKLKYLITSDNLTKKEFFEQFYTVKKVTLENKMLPKFGHIPLYYN